MLGRDTAADGIPLLVVIAASPLIVLRLPPSSTGLRLRDRALRSRLESEVSPPLVSSSSMGEATRSRCLEAAERVLREKYPSLLLPLFEASGGGVGERTRGVRGT